MTLHIDLLILLRTHRVARDKPLHEVCRHAAPLPHERAAEDALVAQAERREQLQELATKTQAAA